jgi:hypothetical protein
MAQLLLALQVTRAPYQTGLQPLRAALDLHVLQQLRLVFRTPAISTVACGLPQSPNHRRAHCDRRLTGAGAGRILGNDTLASFRVSARLRVRL